MRGDVAAWRKPTTRHPPHPPHLHPPLRKSSPDHVPLHVVVVGLAHDVTHRRLGGDLGHTCALGRVVRHDLLSSINRTDLWQSPPNVFVFFSQHLCAYPTIGKGLGRAG